MTRLPGCWWWLLLVALPAALLSLLLPVNRYRETMGLEALDCDGPGRILVLAIPALLLGTAALLGIALRWRQHQRVAAAMLCLATLATASVAATHALAEEWRQAPACVARSAAS